MKTCTKIALDILLWNCFSKIYSTALKNVIIDIEPRVVQFGASALLRCNYDLEDEPLYSVKFYRGYYEFYRYNPKEEPKTKVFPFSHLEVDLEMSNEHQVVLRNVQFNLAGNFTCEVSTDGPKFLTAVDTKDMMVVVLPENPPQLVTEMAQYVIGDILRAECTSSPSRPPAKLTFFLNNILIVEKQQMKIPKENDMWTSNAYMELHLTPMHFNENKLLLRCVAQVTELYQQDTELQLQSIKDPIPERVTSSNAGYLNKFSVTINIMFLCFFII